MTDHEMHEMQQLVAGIGSEVMDTEQALGTLIGLVVNEFAPEGAIEPMDEEMRQDCIEQLLVWASDTLGRIHTAKLLRQASNN